MPIAALLPDSPSGQVVHAQRLPYPNAFVRLPSGLWCQPDAAAVACRRWYLDMLGEIGASPAGRAPPRRQLRPYNLLVTRDWLLAVPRAVEHWRGVSVNALGFAGSLFVTDAAAAARVRSCGPMAVLRAVTPSG